MRLDSSRDWNQSVSIVNIKSTEPNLSQELAYERRFEPAKAALDRLAAVANEEI